eukprot:6180669-Pleurochrysis_carterae.AAC.2
MQGRQRRGTKPAGQRGLGHGKGRSREAAQRTAVCMMLGAAARAEAMRAHGEANAAEGSKPVLLSKSMRSWTRAPSPSSPGCHLTASFRYACHKKGQTGSARARRFNVSKASVNHTHSGSRWRACLLDLCFGGRPRHAEDGVVVILVVLAAPAPAVMEAVNSVPSVCDR